MISIAVLLALAFVNVAAGIEYPPLLVNAAALVVLVAVAWREMQQQKEPGPGR